MVCTVHVGASRAAHLVPLPEPACRVPRPGRDPGARTRAPREPHPPRTHVLFTCLCGEPLPRPSAQTRAAGPRGTRRRARGSFLWRDRERSKLLNTNAAIHDAQRVRARPRSRSPRRARSGHTRTLYLHTDSCFLLIKAVYVPLPLALPNIRQATEPAPRLELEGEPEHLVVPRIEQRPHPKHAVVLCRDVLERQKVCLCAILPSQASD